MKIRLIKFLDRLFGTLAVRCLPAARPASITKPRHILVIRPGGIGDAVLLIPALLDLKTAFPGARITVLAERRNAAVFALTHAVDEVLHYDRPRELLAVLRSRYDAVIDTEQWHRFSAVVTRLLRPALSVGFATNERQRLFTHSVTYSHATYEVDSFRALVTPLGVAPRTTIDVPFLSVPPHAAARATELLGNVAAQPYVVIFPGASIPERRWGAANFRLLAQGLRERGIPVVVIGGREDAREGEAIVASGLALNLAGKTTLAESAAVIARSALLVSGDSGILHMGVALGRATVSLFGPGIAAKWAPRGENHRVVTKGYDCSPCTRFGYTPNCRFGAKCIRDITVAEVFAAVVQLWPQKGAVGKSMAESGNCGG